MTFLWPSMLLTLLFVPVVVALYLRSSAGAGRCCGEFRHSKKPGFCENLVSGPGKAPGLRRHLPPLLFLSGLAVLLVALARPQARSACRESRAR